MARLPGLELQERELQEQELPEPRQERRSPGPRVVPLPRPAERPDPAAQVGHMRQTRPAQPRGR
jgi:hypothetical protein